MFVKICGITNREDALAAVDAGAGALGFIFFDKSPRGVTAEQIEEFVRDIPDSIWKVGVFVNESPAKIEEIGVRLKLDIAQLHGSETPEQYPRGLRVWKAYRVRGSGVPDDFYSWPVEARLLDGPSTGQPFDWSITTAFPGNLIIAGGLDEHNVREAVATAKPWGVDASSRIEASPGRKDHIRMKQFIEAALGS